MKRILFFSLVSTLLACQSPSNPTPNPKLDGASFVKTFFGYFNQHDWAKMAGLYVDTAEFRDPSLGKNIVRQTRQQTIDKYTALNKLFPDLHDSVTNVYVSGDKHIIIEFIASGTGPDNVRVELPICSVLTIEKGRIVRDCTYYDTEEEQK